MVLDMEEVKEDIKKSRAIMGVRHVQALMLFFGMTIITSIQVAKSIAIVAMTDPNEDNSFDWSHQKQSVILSSFQWGYIVLKVHGGIWSAKYGGMIVIALCVGISSLVCLVIPVSASYFCKTVMENFSWRTGHRKSLAISVIGLVTGGWQLMCVCCVIQGLAQGVTYAAVHTLISKWIPFAERSRLSSLIYAGAPLGTAAGLLTAGFIADFWGWPGIFYANGIIGSIWVVIYIFVGSSTPQSSKIIGSEERFYIQNSLGHVGGHKKIKIPWKPMMTSVPFIALIMCNCGSGWGYWTLLTETPTYMSKIYGVNIKANGLISSLPYIVRFLMSFVFGFSSDFVLKKKWIGVTTSRKLYNSISYYGPAAFLIALSYVSGDIVAAVALLTIGYGFTAGSLNGFYMVHLDMAPNHAGTMMGITSGISNLIALGAPLAVGFIIKDENSPEDWRKVFFLAAGIYILTNTIFLFFGTCKRQIWNEPPTDEKNNGSLESKTTDEEKYA